jgi:Right handed beta helix region
MSSLVLFVLLFASTAEAADYYVSKVGADANTCTQARLLNMTKLTISSGVSCLKSGDTLFVKAGVYAEQLSNVIPSGTSWTSPVTVAAFFGDVVTIQPARGASGVLAFTGPNQAYIVIDDMVVDCVNASTNCVSIQQGAHHIKIKNSELKNSPGAGVLGGVNSEFSNLNVHHHKARGFHFSQPNNLIEGSEIHNNGGSGVYLQGASNNTIVRSNRIHENNTAGLDGSGVRVSSATNILVYSNLIYSQSAAHGIELNYNVIKAQLYNNTIAKNPGYGIVVGASNVSGTIIKNNVICSNGGTINNSGTGTILQNNIMQEVCASDPSARRSPGMP